VQAGPFEHELHGQVFPRLTSVAGHKCELGEVVHDLIDAFDMLSRRGYSWSGNAGATKDRDVEFAANGIDRVHESRVYRHLRQPARWERGDRFEADLVVQAPDLANRFDPFVGVRFETGDKSVGVLGDALVAVAVALGFAADHGDLDPAPIHERQEQIGSLRRIGEVAVAVAGLVRERHIFEHVLSGKVHVGRLGVFERSLEKGVTVLARRAGRRAHHRVDYADVVWKSQDLSSRFWAVSVRRR